jgi:hypothetical protein
MSAPHLTGAHVAFESALAELRRCQGLFEGPLTRAKKDLLEQRLNGAGRALALSVETLAYADPEPPFIPPPAAAARGENLVEFPGRRRQT